MKKTNKLFTKLSTIVVSLAMALGVGVSTASNGVFREARATDTVLGDWSTNGTGTYGDGSIKFDGSGDYIFLNNIFTEVITNLVITVNCKSNGGPAAGNVYTAAAINSSGNPINGASATHSGNDITTSYGDMVFTISSNLSDATGIRLTYTTKANSGGNWGIKSISYVATYAGAVKTSTKTTVTAANDKTELDLNVNPVETVQLSAAVTYGENDSGSINDPDISWESSDEDVATVSESGLVTAVAKGTARITGSYAGDEDYRSSFGYVDITVINSREVSATFNFESIASENEWADGTPYTPVVVDGVTLSTNSGGNNAKYYSSDKTWRMYTGGSLSLTPATGYTIVEVVSNPAYEFDCSNGSLATASFTSTIKFKSITVIQDVAKALESIAAELTNNSKNWHVGEIVNASDLTITPHYSDGSDGTPITSGNGVTVTNGTLTVVGENTVNVAFEELNTTVSVTALSGEINAWGVTGDCQAYAGHDFDTSGLILNGWFDNGKTEVVPDYIISNYVMVADPKTADNNVDNDNKITINVYLKTDKDFENIVGTIEEVPAPIVDAPKGAVPEKAFTVAEALAAGAVQKRYVVGIISEITEVSTQYHNATYKISDLNQEQTGFANDMIVYHGKNVGNTNFTSEDQIAIGDKVLVYGNLTLYNEKIQLASGNYIVSRTPETKALSLSVNAETLLYKDEFSYSGTIETAFTNRENSNVKSSVSYTGYDMNAVGNQTVTVHYTDPIYGELTETYQLTVDYDLVTSVTLNHTSVEIGVYHESKDNDLQLEATFNDHTNPLTAITWLSSDPDIATVSSTGLVKGVADGQAVITAKVTDDVFATCNVTVTGDPTLSLSTSTINNKYSGDQPVTLTAYANNFEGKVSYSWTSSNESVATVTGNENTATVNFVAGGEATITVTAASDASGEKSTTCTVTVTQSTATLDDITSEDGNKMYLGSSKTTLTLNTKATIAGNAEDTIAWSSSNEDIARVSDAGVVTANSAGNATITATSSTNDTKTYDVSVLAPTSLKVDASKAKTTYRIGDTFKNEGLSVKATYGDQTELELNTYSVGTPDLTAAGTKEVEVSSFGGKGTYEITVLEDQYYTQIQYVSDLHAGDKLLLVMPLEDGAAKVAKDTITSNDKFFSLLDVTIGEKGIKQTDTTEAQELTLGGQEGAWTFANSSEKLLGVTAAQGGRLAWVDANSETAHTWTISITNDGKFEIKINDINGGYIKYNTKNPRFTNYTSSQDMELPYLYKVGAKTAEDILNEKKQQALADIDTFMLDYAQSAYSETNWATIQGLVTDGKAKVNAATDEAGINAAVKELKDAVKAVKTTEQEAREALAKAIEDAEKEFKAYYEALDLSQYTASGKQALKNAYDNGMAAIKASQTLEMVETALKAAKDALDAVEKSSIVSIEITHLPDKVTYVVGEEANYINLEVTVTYNDQSTQKLFYTDVTIEGFDSTTAGEKTITVKYGDKSTTFTITVEEAPEVTLLGINLSTEEVKTTYNVGDTFDATGLVVTAKYSDGSSEVVTNYSLSQVDMSTAGTKTITVTYEGKTATFTITVNDSTQPGEDLAAAKEAAINELHDYEQVLQNSGEYDEAGCAALGQEYDKGIVLINSATTIAEVNEALTNAKALLDAVAKQGGGDTPEATLESIAVTTNPTTTTYTVGDEFKPDGLVVTATYSDGSTKAVTGYTLSTVDMSTAGTKTITVTYEGKTATFTITVNEAATDPLEEAKANAINELETLVNGLNRADYSDEAWQQIQNALAEARTAINSATDATALNNLVAQVKATINAVKDNLELAKAAALEALEQYYNSFDKNNYDATGVANLTKAYNDGKDAIEAATTTEGIAAALANAKADMDKVQTKPAAPAVKRCGGDIAATSIILSTLALVGAGLLVFKKRKQD